VLVATTPRFVSETGWSCGVAPGTLAGFAAALAQDHRKTVQQFLALQLRGEQLASALMATLQQLLAERPPPAPGALRDGLAILAGTDLRNRLGEIRQPALVIAGARDRLTPAEAGRRLAAALPGGRFLAFEHAAHVPFLTDPDRFVTALADFLPGRVTTA
jgi:pimeloyl-[acyl-carrier protein] methyl ester esterase